MYECGECHRIWCSNKYIKDARQHVQKNHPGMDVQVIDHRVKLQAEIDALVQRCFHDEDH